MAWWMVGPGPGSRLENLPADECGMKRRGGMEGIESQRGLGVCALKRSIRSMSPSRVLWNEPLLFVDTVE